MQPSVCFSDLACFFVSRLVSFFLFPLGVVAQSVYCLFADIASLTNAESYFLIRASSGRTL